MRNVKKILTLLTSALLLTGCERPVNPDAETLFALSDCTKDFFKEFCSLGDDGYLVIERENITTYGSVAPNSYRKEEIRLYYSISSNKIKIDGGESTSISVPNNELEAYLNSISIVTSGEDLVEKFKYFAANQNLTYTYENGVHKANYIKESTYYVDMTNKIAPLVEGETSNKTSKRYLIDWFNFEPYEAFQFDYLYELMLTESPIGCDLTTGFSTMEYFKNLTYEDLKEFPIGSELSNYARYTNLMTIKDHKFGSYFSRVDKNISKNILEQQFDHIDYQRKPMSFVWGSGHEECEHSNYEIVNEMSTVDGVIYTFNECKDCAHCFDIKENIPV